MFTISDFYNILNFMDGTSDISVDANTKVLASSEQSIALNLFDSTIDQVPHITDDYKRLKNFLVNWYASHRTIISTQKQATDIFSLPERDIGELIQSFGFVFSVNSLSSLTKANFFLDLVNLYKVKGTPQTLIDVLQYFGLSDIDIAEYWLEKNSSEDLVFRSERYLPAGVLDITFPDIDFNVMVQNDPHWRLTESQVEYLATINKIALPSKSPYFAVRPRYDLTELTTFMSVLSRLVQDAYDNYILTGNLTRDIKLSLLNIYVSFLELYLSCIYTFGKLYSTTGSTDSSFFCYDGTSVPDIAIIIDQQNDLIARPSSRAEQSTKQDQYYDLFTRQMVTNFLEYNSPGTLLNSMNSSLYGTLNTYIDSGNGEELISGLMGDLNDWVVSNIGPGYPNLVSTVLGFGSLLEINKVINFFKPYHARMVKFEFALIINNPLLDSINIEDSFTDSIVEVVVDFDTADSTSCQICLDSTCSPHYSRETYDCGSQFDIGASIDTSPEIRTEDSIIDILNFHDETSSNAYEQILLTDATNFDSTATFCDGSASLSIVLAGAWADFDNSGLFDSQHGNDIVQIYIQDFDCVIPVPVPPGPTPGTAWATTTSMTMLRAQLAGCGDTSDALNMGGRNLIGGQVQDVTEIWNGSSWATTTSLAKLKAGLAACGVTSDALCFGGHTFGGRDDCEIWNGSTWGVTSSLPRRTQFCSGCGTTSDALSFGGYSLTTNDKYDYTNIWNGSSWATTNVLTELKYFSSGIGTTSAALCIGGSNDGGNLDTTEIWNGSSWATTTVLNNTILKSAAAGDTSNGLVFGGNYGGGGDDNTAIWNGSTWATTTDLNVARYLLAGCGSVSDALSFGGQSGATDFLATTEIWS